MQANYSPGQLKKALSAVRQKKQPIRTAAREFGIPKSTLYDRLQERPLDICSRKKLPRLLTVEEEGALVEFVLYMGGQGFPMTRTMIRVYVREILRRTGRVPLICMETGPSDKWFRGFLARHPQLSERTPENLEKSRARMSSQYTMDGWFELLKKVLRDKKLENKEGQIFNVDEVGWSGKERKKVKVFGQKGAHCFAANNITSCEHVTVNMCICADGRILPPVIIYKESLPHRSMHDGIPGSWLYGKSGNGYMIDGDLFLTWFKEIFLINCGRERPVLLVIDNHDSHVTLPLVETASLNDVVLLGLPAHTTHILQPLDVKVNGPLKTRFSNLATHLGFANPSLSIGRARFPVVLRHAIEQTTPSSVRQAFVATGIVPFNPQAIDKSQLVPATFTKTNEQTGEKENSNVKTCEACGSFLTNPLVDQGVIPQSMAQVLVPPPQKTTGKSKSSRIVTEGRVISGDEMLKKLEEKEEVMRRQMEEKEERLRLKEQRKQQKEKEEEKVEKKKRREEEKKKKEQELKEERMKKAVGGRLAHKRFTCAVCGERGRVNDEMNGVMWYGCDDGMCGRWYHEECLGQSENEYLKESESDDLPWNCAVCKPWLYEEE